MRTAAGMDIIFKCTSCGRELSIDASGAGLEVNCPICQALLKVPDASTSDVPLKQTIPLMPFEPPKPPAAPPPPAPPSPPKRSTGSAARGAGISGGAALYNLPGSAAQRSPPTGQLIGDASRGTTGPVKAVVTDVDMPLSQMMVITLKWALAALPAFTLLFLLGVLLNKLLDALLR
ncbi:MAG: hypothetical protein RMM51_08390 [Verrucomicrobiae bacterium]|nr:hypothetical protein [Verrucomicrobiae bacterium]